MCFLPESLRGAQITQLNPSLLEWCTETEPLHDEDLNAASTSHNFLTRGELEIFRSFKRFNERSKKKMVYCLKLDGIK